MINKKIIGATVNSFNGIKFKSKAETVVYNTLVSAGFDPKYEERKFILIGGFKPTVPFYTYKNKQLALEMSKIRDITYTPDFTFPYGDKLIIIEVKGFQNDIYPLKRKLFRAYMENSGEDYLFFEIYTKKQLLQAIEVIKSCKQQSKELKS